LKEEQKGLLKLKYPICHGVINDWKSMDLIWKYVFQELKVSPKESPVFITEPPMNPFEQKVQTAQLFFESYGVPAFYMGIQGVLSLFASGKTSGVVLDIGDGISHVLPVFEGYGLPHAYGRVDLAGRDITEYL
jgi:actin-related protein